MEVFVDIRSATIEDLGAIRTLFYDTVTHVNVADYNSEQITEWADIAMDTGRWIQKICQQQFIVASIETMVVGFASLDTTGFVDLLYTHKDFQRKGIAIQLLTKLEEIALSKGLADVWTDSSITARPFFLKAGFRIVREYKKTLGDIDFRNTIMRKALVSK